METARSGIPTLVLNGKAIHSRFDPLREAARAAGAIPSDTNLVVLAGLGLGYVAQAILEQHKCKRLIIADSDETALSRIMEIRDISSLLGNKRVKIICGGNPGDIRGLIADGPVGEKIHYLPWRPSIDSNPPWYIELSRTVSESARRRAVNARTLERFGSLWIRNLFANTAILPSALSLSDWKNTFNDIPALILAGGPSLQMLLPRLAELRERFLVIAVDTALPALKQCQISPDVVAAVDPQYWNTRHLDRSNDVHEALILAESATHPAVFRQLKGRPILSRTRFPLGTVFEDAAGLKGELHAGGSVATAAWDFARHLGCRPMVAAGLDLGYPEGITHYSGSLSRERPHLFSTRLRPAQDSFFQALKNASPYAVANTGGGTILSDARLDVYHAWFTESISALSDRAPGRLDSPGRYIEGMRSYTMEALLKHPPCRKKIEAKLKEMRDVKKNPLVPGKIKKAVEELHVALEYLVNLAETAKFVAQETLGMMNEGRDISRELKIMDSLDKKIMSTAALGVISFLMQPIIMKVNSEDTSSPKEQTTPIKNSLRIYEEMELSSRYQLRHIQKTGFCNGVH